MKRINLFTLLVLMLLLVVPALLPAATLWSDVRVPVTQLLSIVLTIFGVPVIIKLGRKLGITIDEQLAADAIDALINILVNIDLGKKYDDPVVKKQMATAIAMNSLSNAQQDVLVKKYGSLEAAVQVAFERSSLNKGGTASAGTKGGK
jgi:hypothetical protein